MTNKKIGIISLYSYSVNYGGVLQAFAMNQLLLNAGFEPQQIVYSNTSPNYKKKKTLKDFLSEHTVSYVLKKPFNLLLSRCPNKIRKFFNSHAEESIRLRAKVFENFRKNRITHTQGCNQNNIAEKCSFFDGYICGSDQVWNPGIADENYLLSFVPDGKTRFSYAASIPQSSIPADKLDLFKNNLALFDGISVREENSVELIKSLCNKDVTWVLDPTLLMSAEEWIKYAEPYPIKGDYVFCYFLGTDKRFRRAVKKYAKANNLKIVTFPYLLPEPNSADKHFGDIRICDANPLQFVSLIKNAKCVFADSFHAAAFSINLHTDFYVFQRSESRSMGSRMTSLLKLANCRERLVCKYKDVKRNNKTINWKNADINLEKQRQVSYAYLNEQLKKI